MMEPQLWNWILPLSISALVISAVAFYEFFVKPKRNSIDHDRTVSTVTSNVGSVNIAGDTVADVIIVGAGVAGSALAYTLGKVIFHFSPSLFDLTA